MRVDLPVPGPRPVCPLTADMTASARFGRKRPEAAPRISGYRSHRSIFKRTFDTAQKANRLGANDL
jgi:hypothetical protein